MPSIENIEGSRADPLEVVERLATTHAWSFERANDEELIILVRGRWSDQQVSFIWIYELEALHLACAFEFRVPPHCRPEVVRLISLINERMWVGHFDFWVQENLVMYRHALVLPGGVTASGRQCEVMLNT